MFRFMPRLPLIAGDADVELIRICAAIYYAAIYGATTVIRCHFICRRRCHTLFLRLCHADAIRGLRCYAYADYAAFSARRRPLMPLRFSAYFSYAPLRRLYACCWRRHGDIRLRHYAHIDAAAATAIYFAADYAVFCAPSLPRLSSPLATRR